MLSLDASLDEASLRPRLASIPRYQGSAISSIDQGWEIPRKTVSIRYYTYYIILGINTAGIIGLRPTDQPTDRPTHRPPSTVTGERARRRVGGAVGGRLTLLLSTPSGCLEWQCHPHGARRSFVRAAHLLPTSDRWRPRHPPPRPTDRPPSIDGDGRGRRGVILDNTVWRWRVLGIIRIILY